MLPSGTPACISHNWEFSLSHLRQNNIFFRYDLNKVQYVLGNFVVNFVSKPVCLTLWNACETLRNTAAFYYISNAMNLVNC